VAILLTRKNQDIRPRALLGAANFHLNTSKISAVTGDAIPVTVSVEVTNANAKVSGVDFTLLYDKSKLRLTSVSPTLGTNFTDVPVKVEGQPYTMEGNGNFNYVRVALVSKKANADLPKGTIALASVTFEALANGQGVIKFPDDSSVLQVVGTNP
jgi:hypothetical protein